jgi:hypothetical protein
MNEKYDPPRAVLISECHPERAYTLEQFEELGALLPDPKILATSSKPPQASYSIGVLNPQKVVNVLSKLWPDADRGKRHAFAKHIGGWLAHKFVDEDDAVMLGRRAAEAATDDDVDDRVRVVRDSFRAHAADKPVTGLPRAFEIVPELKDVVSILNEGLESCRARSSASKRWMSRRSSRRRASRSPPRRGSDWPGDTRISTRKLTRRRGRISTSRS